MNDSRDTSTFFAASNGAAALVARQRLVVVMVAGPSQSRTRAGCAPGRLDEPAAELTARSWKCRLSIYRGSQVAWHAVLIRATCSPALIPEHVGGGTELLPVSVSRAHSSTARSRLVIGMARGLAVLLRALRMRMTPYARDPLAARCSPRAADARHGNAQVHDHLAGPLVRRNAAPTNRYA